MFKRIFGIGRTKHSDPIGEVYNQLRAFERLYGLAGLTVDYRAKAPPELIARLYVLSNDTKTTVHLVRVLQEKEYCEHLNKVIDPQKVVEELGAEEAKRDAEDHYDAAKKFCHHIIDLGATGQISKDPRVGAFLEANLGAIMTSAASYSMKFSRPPEP